MISTGFSCRARRARERKNQKKRQQKRGLQIMLSDALVDDNIMEGRGIP
jgi:hypothetical protein